ncbi:Tll0287-like domain-containing protein [Pseudomaricurvus sp.]|uniref:Tll0287-like domain-containing protein n=1 Tax=Pseudomaricurvus sp. TaxID=2004510 RepID=UPI003F6CBC3B
MHNTHVHNTIRGLSLKLGSRLTLGLSVILGLSTATLASASDQEDIQQARQATAELQRQLGSQLKAALSEGGIAQGIKVCAEAAPSIAANLSSQYQKAVGRTALRTRNPNNAATEAQQAVLETFQQDIQNQKNPKELEHFSVREDGTKLYMRPIVTQPQCLACHGDISDSRRAEIHQYYPHDQATGFKAGELRGAFVVTWE